MLARRYVAGFLLVVGSVLGGALAGCGNPNGLDSIQVTPATESINTGQTAQLTAIGTFGNAKHSNQQNVTTAVTWTSNKPSVATVSNTGLVTAVGAGTATITATAEAFNGQTTSTALVTVTGQGGGGGSNNGGSLLSLTIIPSSITVGNLQDTGNFLAIGTFSVAPFVRDMTNTVTWLSSAPDVFPVNSNSSATNPGAPGGVVTAYGSGGATITAEATNPSDGSLQAATATFNCPLVLPNPPTTPGSCYPGSQAPAIKATITVFNEGLNTSKWEITAPSATGTPNVIHCGPGWISSGGTDQVCEAAYPIDPTGATTSKIIVEAQGGLFGGWSWTCLPSDKNGNPIPATAETQAGPNYCTVLLSAGNPNVTVGGIFN